MSHSPSPRILKFFCLILIITQLFFPFSGWASSNFYANINERTKAGVDVAATAFTDVSKLFTLTSPYRAWQGVASDGKFLYVISDRNKNFNLENIISKYDLRGNLIQEKKSAYNPFPTGDFYSFGDATVIDKKLYVTAYNFNDNARPLKSRIAVFNLSDLSLIEDFDLGTEVKIAEGIDGHGGFYWVVDGNIDTFVVKKYNKNFTLQSSYALPVIEPISGLTYQSLDWRGNEIFVNWHGSNNFGSAYAYGLDRYSFDGSNFSFEERITPVSYGAGQGIEFVGDTLFWVDRPENSIYKSTYIGTGNSNANPVSVFRYFSRKLNSVFNKQVTLEKWLRQVIKMGFIY